jgi:hypothetical protein
MHPATDDQCVACHRARFIRSEVYGPGSHLFRFHEPPERNIQAGLRNPIFTALNLLTAL